MSVREKINGSSGAAIALIVLIAAGAMAMLLPRGDNGGPSDEAYFTDDDGKTFFADSRAKLPPFDRGGKQAVRAVVYEANGVRFVNHVERYTPAGLRAVSAAANATTPPPASAGPTMEVKRPGDAKWTPTSDMQDAAPIMTVRLPAGASGEATLVEP